MKTEQEQIAELKVSELRKVASELNIKNIKSFDKAGLVAEVEKAFAELEIEIESSNHADADELVEDVKNVDAEGKVVEVQKLPVERVEIDRIKALDRSKSEKFRMLFTRGMRACDIATEFKAHYSFVYGAIQRMNQD